MHTDLYGTISLRLLFGFKGENKNKKNYDSRTCRIEKRKYPAMLRCVMLSRMSGIVEYRCSAQVSPRQVGIKMTQQKYNSSNTA